MSLVGEAGGEKLVLIPRNGLDSDPTRPDPTRYVVFFIAERKEHDAHSATMVEAYDAGNGTPVMGGALPSKLPTEVSRIFRFRLPHLKSQIL
ncbi:hypothetical protein AXF42_Ash002379 [Apostasia shenzhenica]|uniref:Uncharacterized protein n=1 Tax=Apostasia shenzhenica TaxID=1088818 RepID=A0A2I0ANK3_9ASPA|nr:hypothetical protein AXF42_Ash002379 [Apostasia shenzhenica]